jgi:hypothetical protein
MRKLKVRYSPKLPSPTAYLRSRYVVYGSGVVSTYLYVLDRQTVFTNIFKQIGPRFITSLHIKCFEFITHENCVKIQF